MAKWSNFNIWRGRLPHWRADDVNYYVTFRHKRPLGEDECHTLLTRLLSHDGKRLELSVLCVLPVATEMIFKVREDPKGGNYELSDVIERAKTKAGKDIIKKSGEKWPPFYSESFDRIVRDEAEFEELFLKIIESADAHSQGEDWACLFVPDRPA